MRAHSFALVTCSDPDCGIHFELFDREHRLLCDMVLPRDSIDDVIACMRGIQYQKAVEDDYRADNSNDRNN